MLVGVGLLIVIAILAPGLAKGLLKLAVGAAFLGTVALFF